MAFLADLRELFQTQAERLRNRPFLQAAMAASALVATADGEVSFSERVRVDELLGSLELLKLYDVHTAVDLFNDYVAALEKDRDEGGDEGRAEVFAAVEKFAEDPQCGHLLLRISRAVCEADGAYVESERRAVEELAKRLNLPPHLLV
ncbi:TerB family tellurite resistance protein [Algihabitans albus]|uniref:TerB family tellurite resistance protein n=1 Tax=Algihabitans albus TaxID=2164067 RepID=UPI000E5D16D8|nr:TerB family tellurite resistance protein [Algihabitans albus]